MLDISKFKNKLSDRQKKMIKRILRIFLPHSQNLNLLAHAGKTFQQNEESLKSVRESDRFVVLKGGR